MATGDSTTIRQRRSRLAGIASIAVAHFVASWGSLLLSHHIADLQICPSIVNGHEIPPYAALLAVLSHLLGWPLGTSFYGPAPGLPARVPADICALERTVFVRMETLGHLVPYVLNSVLWAFVLHGLWVLTKAGRGRCEDAGRL